MRFRVLSQLVTIRLCSTRHGGHVVVEQEVLRRRQGNDRAVCIELVEIDRRAGAIHGNLVDLQVEHCTILMRLPGQAHGGWPVSTELAKVRIQLEREWDLGHRQQGHGTIEVISKFADEIDLFSSGGSPSRVPPAQPGEGDEGAGHERVLSARPVAGERCWFGDLSEAMAVH